MSFILAILKKIDDMFPAAILPLDNDYSYQARRAEIERQRKASFPPVDTFGR
ncbi:hypothetical protein [Burkholderia guangdongensis]|uniref:hypothetical protein n=1 Tax=Burkholderia guangdongensis TaxID=1792500 RepID=UPI0015CE792E|nr:hypothetical protein [Burkholderia guangdongensis]